MKTLALFDFDGTLYRKDSLFEFTKFAKGKVAFYLGMLSLLPSLIIFKLKIITNETAKTKFINHFYKDMSQDEFTLLAKDFALHMISQDLNSQIFNSFCNHLQANHQVCIVSASCKDWIQPWSDQHSAKFIGTELEIQHGKITGNFSTKNCYGPEKVNRIKEQFDLSEFDRIIVYGRGKGDREMLQLSK